jgi:uncharacterized repeat protein (TIGR03803 family)
MRRKFLASVVLTSVALLNVTPSTAQTVTYSVLGATSSSNPVAPLIQAQDGRLYGTAENRNANTGLAYSTSLGGTFNFGLYSFQGGTDGGLPEGPVVQAPNGTFYGAADFGGANSSGVIYGIAATAGTGTGKETTTYPFAGASDGCQPQSSLIFDNAGNLYGTTPCGGANGRGVVFKYNPGSGVLTPLHAFCAQANCPDGDAPQAGMVQGSDGNFYGTASGGNASANGVIYRLSTSGTYTLLYTFCAAAGCADGAAPQGPLVENRDGNFYGATAQGGAFGHGTVFKVTPGGTLTTLYSFTGAADGSAPLGALVVGSDGTLYGATELGGSDGFGTVYRITPTGAFTSLHSFTDSSADSNPNSGLVQASDGNFYGTTSGLIHDSEGAVYKMALSPAMAAPVQLAFSPASGKAGTAATLNWKVLNAFSQTLQNCYASVQGSSAGAGTWSGQQAGAYSATTGLFSGSAQVTPTAAGTYTYALSCGGQESGFATLAVGNSGSATPTITLSATPNPAAVGQVVTISATATGSGATPTGTVAIMYGARTLATLPLASGSASISPSTAGVPAGNYLLTASYSGDTNYGAAVSAGYTVTLNKMTPAISLSATPNPVGIGQTVTITATASGSGAAPTGTVAFKYGSLTLASLPLSGGTASFAQSTNGLPPGTYDLTASYSGDASYGAANSSAYGVTISKDATVVALSATPLTVVQGSPCTLKATVTRSGVAGIPTGTVRFSVGSKALATAAVNAAGVASITASTAGVAVGYYPVIATYSGDGTDNGATSPTVTVYVRPSGYGY